MSYLICNKCGGYYTLEGGEKPEDFEMCQCGGSLKHVSVWDPRKQSFRGSENEFSSDLRYIQNFNSHIDEELDPINEINICPDCGTGNTAGEKFSKSRGKMAKNTKNKENDSSNAKDTLNGFKMPDNIKLRAISIVIGILIVVIPTFLFAAENYALALLLIAGVIVALITGGTTEDGALNGIIMGLIAALIILIFRGNFIFTDDTIVNTGIIIFEMGGAILIMALFGLIGGVIGTLIRDIIIKAENKL